MEPLTERQREVLEFIEQFRKTHGRYPTFKQITVSLGFKSTATIQFHIKGLQEKGYISREPYGRRDFKILQPVTKAMGIPLELVPQVEALIASHGEG